VQSAVGQFPVIGDQLGSAQGLSGGALGVVVGIAGRCMEVSAFGQAVQNAMDTLRAVPRTTGRIPSGRVSEVFCCSLVLGSALIVTTVLRRSVARRSRSGYRQSGHCGAVGADQCGRVSGRFPGPLRPGTSPTVRWLPVHWRQRSSGSCCSGSARSTLSQVVKSVERHQ